MNEYWPGSSIESDDCYKICQPDDIKEIFIIKSEYNDLSLKSKIALLKKLSSWISVESSKCLEDAGKYLDEAIKRT